jgi:hypothetical protein
VGVESTPREYRRERERQREREPERERTESRLFSLPLHPPPPLPRNVLVREYSLVARKKKQTITRCMHRSTVIVVHIWIRQSVHTHILTHVHTYLLTNHYMHTCIQTPTNTLLPPTHSDLHTRILDTLWHTHTHTQTLSLSLSLSLAHTQARAHTGFSTATTVTKFSSSAALACSIWCGILRSIVYRNFTTH